MVAIFWVILVVTAFTATPHTAVVLLCKTLTVQFEALGLLAVAPFAFVSDDRKVDIRQSRIRS